MRSLEEIGVRQFATIAWTLLFGNSRHSQDLARSWNRPCKESVLAGAASWKVVREPWLVIKYFYGSRFTIHDTCMTDEEWMLKALAQAREAQAAGEVPVGAVLVKGGELISQAWNRPIATSDPTAHAEILALRAGAARLGNYRLPGCELYVTLEPCAMCAGAIIQARLRRVIFAADDPRAGAAGSVFNILGGHELNHYVEVDRGLMAEESTALLQTFFRARRRGSLPL